MPAIDSGELTGDGLRRERVSFVRAKGGTMASGVSLKPLAAEIKKTNRKLRELSRKTPPSQRGRIKRDIRRLDLMVREVMAMCKGGGFNVVTIKDRR
jgi:hypothetical protein